MALLYAPQKKQKTTQKVVAEIQDLDYQGLGVAKFKVKPGSLKMLCQRKKLKR